MKNRDGENIVATIQARMGSTRLPGKVLLTAQGKPFLTHMVNRLKRAKLVDNIVVATTVNKKDDPIVDLCKKEGIAFYRGSEEDVLGRLWQALKKYKATINVELTGDCPLVDPAIVDMLIDFYLKHDYDLVTNFDKVTYPSGFDLQVYSTETLTRAEKMAKSPEYREHTSLYMKRHRDIFSIYNIEAPKGLCYPDYYVEIDEESDYKVLKSIFDALYPENPDFSALDVVNFLNDNPKISRINQRVERRWKKV